MENILEAAKMGERIFEPIEHEVSNSCITRYQKKVQLTLSMNKSDACAVGGVALIIMEILQNPAGWRKENSPMF